MKVNRVTVRPIFMLCALFFVFSILLPYTLSAVKLFLIGLSAAALIILNTLSPARRSPKLDVRVLNLGAAALATACMLSVCFIDLPVKQASELDGLTLEAEVSIEDICSVSSNFGYYTARLKNDEHHTDVKVYLAIPDGSAVFGDIFTGTFTLSVPLEEDMSERYSKAIFLNAEAENVKYIGNERSFRLSKFFSDINDTLSAKLNGTLDGHGALASAVLLGSRDNLDAVVKRDFSRLGIYHLLAVSGLHLSVIISILDAFLNITKLRRGIKGILKAACILGFMALTGFSASVMRAGIMHLFAVFAGIIDKESDSLTCLASAAAIIVLVDPVSVYDAGLILSVLAAYACISYSILSRDKAEKSGTRPTRFRKAIKSMTDTIKLTLLINTVTLPVMWFVFGELSLVSPFTNVIFIPLITVLLFLSIIYLPLCGIPYLSSLVAQTIAVIEDIITKTAGTISHLPHITVSMRFAGIGLFSLLLFLCIIPMALVSKKFKKALGIGSAVSAVCLAGCLLIGIALSSTSCQAYYTVRGKNEGFLLRYGNDYTVVDISDGSSGIHYDMLTIAKEAGAVEIDKLVLTHYHTKHISSLPVTADRAILRRVLLPAPENDDDAEVCGQLISACKERGIDVVIYERAADESYTDGTLTFDFHEYTRLSRSTHPVVSFTFTLGDRAYVYAGGSAGESDSDILSEIKNADTVFFGAHPPVTKSVSGVEPHGAAVVSAKAVNDTLFECLDDAASVTVVKDNEVYSTGSYKKEQ